MQWDPFLTDLYYIDNGIWLLVLLVIPAMALRGLAWYIERTSKKAFIEGIGNQEGYRIRYEKRPLLWTTLYNISNGMATLLVTIWFLITFGLAAAFTGFLCMAYFSGLFANSLADIANRLNKELARETSSST